METTNPIFNVEGVFSPIGPDTPQTYIPIRMGLSPGRMLFAIQVNGKDQQIFTKAEMLAFLVKAKAKADPVCPFYRFLSGQKYVDWLEQICAQMV